MQFLIKKPFIIFINFCKHGGIKLKKIITILAVGVFILAGYGVVADNAKIKTEIVEVNGGIGHLNIVIENTGGIAIENLEYQVSIQGGILNNIDIKESSNINFLGMQSSEKSKTSKIVFGFGKIDISVDADYAESWSGQGLVFGPFILVT